MSVVTAITDIRLLYVTTKDLDQARAIARALLDQRLIACANIIPQMESIYRWKGVVEYATEAILILKTRASLVEKTTQVILELHSSETPCVLCLPVETGAEGYLNWLSDELFRREESDGKTC